MWSGVRKRFKLEVFFFFADSFHLRLQLKWCKTSFEKPELGLSGVLMETVRGRDCDLLTGILQGFIASWALCKTYSYMLCLDSSWFIFHIIIPLKHKSICLSLSKAAG